MTPDQPHALYRFYDATGALLYIGISFDPGSRWRSHASDKPWWHEVRGISVETYPDRDAVLAAERRAIQVENPRYNVQRPTPKRAARAERPVRLVWICDVCRMPIADGQGYLHVDNALVYEHEEFHRQRDLEQAADHSKIFVDLSEIQSWPQAAPWLAHHEQCDPTPDHSCYWLDVARARTHAHLLDWSAHLLEKSWITSTNWADLIRRMAGVDA